MALATPTSWVRFPGNARADKNVKTVTCTEIRSGEKCLPSESIEMFDINIFSFCYRIEELQLSDMGSYQCAVFSGEDEILSIEGYIELEGISLFLKSIIPKYK